MLYGIFAQPQPELGVEGAQEGARSLGGHRKFIFGGMKIELLSLQPVGKRIVPSGCIIANEKFAHFRRPTLSDDSLTDGFRPELSHLMPQNKNFRRP